MLMLECAKHLVRGVSGWSSIKVKLIGPAKPFVRAIACEETSLLDDHANKQTNKQPANTVFLSG